MPYRFSERDITVGTGDWQLPGTFTYPSNAKHPVPAVVLVHGSGPNDRDETIGPTKVFRDLAHGLAKRGVAVLRYDKRTRIHMEKIKPLMSDFTLKEEAVDDAVAAVEALRNCREVDASRIYVLGHSLGATLVPWIAKEDPRIAGIISMAGLTQNPFTSILAQFEHLLRHTEADEHQQALRKLIDTARLAKEAAENGATEPQTFLNIPLSYWRNFAAYDAVATAVAVDKPMLILQGQRDYQVTVRGDLALWRKGLQHNPKVTIRLFRKLNHLFLEQGTGPSLPAEYFTPAHIPNYVLRTIASWVKAQK